MQDLARSFVHCLDNQRKASGQVVSGAAVELYPLTHFSGDNTKTIVLDLVQPLLAAGRSLRSKTSAN